MPGEKKHSCKTLVCPDCGKRYSAKSMELLVFSPFNMERKGKRSETQE